MKKIFTFLFITLFTLPLFASAGVTLKDYTELAPLTTSGEPAQADVTLEGYIQNTYFFGIGVAIALSVIMIVYGGIQYMSSDAIMKKSDGKNTVQKAVLGLLLALGSFLIINTISPGILRSSSILDGTLSNIGVEKGVSTSEVTYEEPPEIVEVFSALQYGFYLERKQDGVPFEPPATLPGHSDHLFDRLYTGSSACANIARTAQADPSRYWCARYVDYSGQWCYTATQRSKTGEAEATTFESQQVTCGPYSGIITCDESRANQNSKTYIVDGTDYRFLSNCTNDVSVCTNEAGNKPITNCDE